MDQGNHEWHYTRGADQAGPVSFEQLRAIAAAGEIHPRTDLVWHHGMDEWKPAGEIDGLFAKASQAGETSSASPIQTGNSEHRYQKEVVREHGNVDAPIAAPAARSEGKKAFEDFDLWPGASRRWYLLMVYLFPLVWLMIAFAFGYYIGQHLPPSMQKIFILTGVIVPVWAVIDTSLTRLSNLGMSKFWAIAYFVPLLNLWIGYRSFACPAGYAKHRKMDGPGWFLAILYWIMILSSSASAVIIPTTFAKIWSKPEVRQRIAQIAEQIEAAQKPGKTTLDNNNEKREERKKREEAAKAAKEPANPTPVP